MGRRGSSGIRAFAHSDNGDGFLASGRLPKVQGTQPTMVNFPTPIDGDVPLETTRGRVAPDSQCLRCGSSREIALVSVNYARRVLHVGRFRSGGGSSYRVLCGRDAWTFHQEKFAMVAFD